jgi:uncharacterized phage-associated protein
MEAMSEGHPAARYAVHTAKAVETIVWLANAKPGIDVYHVVKCAFFADKDHLNRFGRPIAGDDYDADTYGPLGRSIYRLLRQDPIEMIALGGNGALPFRVFDDERWVVRADREANLRILSRSDVDALRRALDEIGDLSFDELVDRTHAEPAYVAANGGRMRYEDLLDPADSRRDEKAADLADAARHAVF